MSLLSASSPPSVGVDACASPLPAAAAAASSAPPAVLPLSPSSASTRTDTNSPRNNNEQPLSPTSSLSSPTAAALHTLHLSSDDADEDEEEETAAAETTDTAVLTLSPRKRGLEQEEPSPLPGGVTLAENGWKTKPLTPIKRVESEGKEGEAAAAAVPFSFAELEQEQPAAAAAAAAVVAPVPCRASSPPSVSPPFPTSWPWYLRTAIAGAPNLAYANFVPIKRGVPAQTQLSEEEMAMWEEAEWWGGGMESKEQKGEEEERKVPDDTNGALHKRAKLSSDALLSPSDLFSRLPPDSHNVNLLSSFGQDSFFSVSSSLLGCCVLGVADGVGGWRDNGVDSGEVSRALMRAARDTAVKQAMQAARGRRNNNEQQQSQGAFALSPSDLMTRAYLQVKRSGEVYAGSTTACIVALTPEPIVAVSQFEHEEEERLSKEKEAAAMNGFSTGNFMSDVALAVSLQSEQLVAEENGEGAADMEAELPQADQHSTSAPIAIPNVTLADPVIPSPEPALLPPSPLPVIPSLPSPLSSSSPSSFDRVYLSAANLGDSGYIIFRRESNGLGPYKVVSMSDLQRTGRTVKQLAVIPEAFQGQSYCDDSPAEAMLDAHQVQEDDLLVLASDGLWDNLIAGEFEYSFYTGWRLRMQQEGEKSRKERMVAVLESIVEHGAANLAHMRQMRESASAAQQQESSGDLKVDVEEQKQAEGETPTSLSRVSSTELSMEEDVPSTTSSTDSASSGLGQEEEACAPIRPITDITAGSMQDALMSDVLPPLTIHPLSSPSPSTSRAPTASPPPITDWDLLEVQCVADALKSFATKFMQDIEGKPDDLSIIVAKIKKKRTEEC